MIRYVYPGSFSPPTMGHFKVAERASQTFPQVTALCSRNTDKEMPWFGEKECKKMWLSYPLPKNVMIETFDDFRKNVGSPERLVMIRGNQPPRPYGRGLITKQASLVMRPACLGIQRSV